jgi:hypothetical protein
MVKSREDKNVQEAVAGKRAVGCWVNSSMFIIGQKHATLTEVARKSEKEENRAAGESI